MGESDGSDDPDDSYEQGTPPKSSVGTNDDASAQPNPDSEVDQKVAEYLGMVLGPLVKDPAERRAVVSRITQLQFHQGPLPPPEQLQHYAQIDPAAVPTILGMARGEQAHRHRLTMLQTIFPFVGLSLGFLAFLSCVGGAIFLALNGKAGPAYTLAGATTFGVIALMIRGRISSKPPTV